MPDENNQNNTSGGDGNTNVFTPESMAAFTKSLENLNVSITKLSGLAEAGNTRNTVVDPIEDETEDADTTVDETDLETMNRSDYAKYIIDNTLKAINKQFAKPITDKVSGVENTVQAQQIRSQLDKLAADNKDFWDWKDEMVELSKQLPGVPVGRIYQLVKADNPAKVEELKAKYTPESDKKKDPLKDAKKGYFGGFTPSGTASGNTKNTKMSTADAVEAAFEEITNKYGDIFS